jgi:hypothetical protein
MQVNISNYSVLSAWRGERRALDNVGSTNPCAAKAALRLSRVLRSQAVRRLNYCESLEEDCIDSLGRNMPPSKLRFCHLADGSSDEQYKRKLDLLGGNPDEYQSPKKEGQKTTESSFSLRLSEEGSPEWLIVSFARRSKGGPWLSAAWQRTLKHPFLMILLVVLSLGVCVTSTLQPAYGSNKSSTRYECIRSPSREGYIYTSSSALLRGYSLRQFGPSEAEKFISAVAYALGVSSAEVQLLSANLEQVPNFKQANAWSPMSWGPSPRKELRVQFEVAVPNTVDLSQHTLRLHSLSLSGLLQRMLRDVAGISCESLETKHAIKRPR